MARAALGVRDHCGWAVLVGLTGDSAAPRLLLRERITLLDDPALPDQPYHAAAGLELAAAADLIARVERSARTAARTALARAVGELGHEPAGVALDLGAVGAGRMALPGELGEVLSKHHYLHGAEGELYHEALAEAARDLGLAVGRYDFKTLAETAARVLGPGAARVRGLRAQVGPPWTRDHKDAALAALLLLDGG